MTPTHEIVDTDGVTHVIPDGDNHVHLADRCCECRPMDLMEFDGRLYHQRIEHRRYDHKSIYDPIPTDEPSKHAKLATELRKGLSKISVPEFIAIPIGVVILTVGFAIGLIIALLVPQEDIL